MPEDNKPQMNTAAPAANQPARTGAGPVRVDSRPGGFRRRPGPGGPGGRDRKPFMRKKEEFQEQVVDLRRVARVMAGGKRFRFRATIILGDLKGRVGVGMGKGLDVAQSVAKAKHDAQKKMITVQLVKGTIPHEVEAKYSAARVKLKPAKEGNGLVAGGAVRAVLSLAGIKDITAKCLGRTPNKVTNALATVEALKNIRAVRRSFKPKSEVKEEVKA